MRSRQFKTRLGFILRVLSKERGDNLWGKRVKGGALQNLSGRASGGNGPTPLQDENQYLLSTPFIFVLGLCTQGDFVP